MYAGKYSPVDITVTLLKHAMEKAGWEKKRFLIEGFPRNQDHYDGWNAMMGDSVNVSRVLLFDCK